MPARVVAPVMSTVIRYAVLQAGSFTAQELLSFWQIGIAGSSNCLCSAVRIRKLEMWIQAPSGTTPEAYGVQWNVTTGTIGAPTTLKIDTPASVSFPGHAVYRPPSGSFADLWHSDPGDSTGVFYLFAPSTGTTYLDISYDYTLNFTQTARTAVFATPAVTGELSFYTYGARLAPVLPASSTNTNP